MVLLFQPQTLTSNQEDNVLREDLSSVKSVLLMLTALKPQQPMNGCNTLEVLDTKEVLSQSGLSQIPVTLLH